MLLQELVPHLLSGAAYLDVHTSNGGALLRWYGAAPAADGSYDTQHVEGQIMQLLSVLAHSLFRQRPATLSAFGGVFWAPLVAQYEAAFLQQIQGSSVAVLQARQEAARSMEQQAVSMGLAEPGGWVGPTLCVCVCVSGADTPQLVAAFRCEAPGCGSANTCGGAVATQQVCQVDR